MKHIWWKIEKYWDAFRDYCFPKQKWLIKKIPNRWIDKDRLWEICILEGIKHLVEGEELLAHFESSQADPEYPEGQKKNDRELKENYELITKTLPLKQAELDSLFKRFGVEFKEDVGIIFTENLAQEIGALEEEIEDLKTQIMIWAIKKRGYLWM